MKIKVKKEFKQEGSKYKPGETVEIDDSLAEDIIGKGFAEKAEESEEVPDITDEVGQSEEKTESSEGEKIPEKLNNLIHEKYHELWGENYQVPKKQLMKKMFRKESTNELTQEEASKWNDELDRRTNQKDIEEKAEEEVTKVESGGGQKQVLKQNKAKEKEGISIDKARERAETMGSPEMVKNLIKDMDFEELGQYVWDPEKNRDLPYDDLEPKVDLYEMVHPLWEMYTGWSYNIEDFEFNRNDEDGAYECTITIIRKGGPSDPTKIKFTKTKKKSNLMSQAQQKKGIEKEQWKEFMQSLAYKRAMRPQMRLWVDKFVNAYRKAKGR